jgi:hypothetical protein
MHRRHLSCTQLRTASMEPSTTLKQPLIVEDLERRLQ